MRKDPVEIGTRYGKWTVLKDLGCVGGGSRKLLCKCDCGNQREVYYNHLKRGNTTSCRKCNVKEIVVGAVVGEWTVLNIQEYVGRGSRRMATCRCSCGNIKELSVYKLAYGKTKSCGHKRSNAKDYHRLYVVYNHIIARCYNPKDHKYKDYGGRGITVCGEWRGDNGFDRFVEWSYRNGYDENAEYMECTIDRIDVNGNYEPSNCRWADGKTQANNKRNTIRLEYNGESHTITEWSEILGISRHLIDNRYRRGYPIGKILYKGNLKTRANKGE